MLRELTIRNFRAFKELFVSGLERINLIAGKNNSGKTAFLEALHLLGNPSKPLLPGLLNEQRGIIRKDPMNSGRWLFLDGDNSQKMELRVEADHGKTLDLAIDLVDGVTANAPRYSHFGRYIFKSLPIEVWASNSPRMLLEGRREHGKVDLAIAIYQTLGGTLSVGSISPIRSSIFVTSHDRAIEGVNQLGDDANELFSEIEAAGRQEEVISVLRHLEPRLEGLVLLTFSGETMLHGRVGNKRPIPIALMGEGFRRLLIISLIIASRRNAVVLIDEIENGLHYSVIPTIWLAIGDAARNSDVQIFATTHSWECIRSAYEAFTEHGANDFRFIRLDRNNGETTAISYDQEMIETALLAGVEMR